MVAHRTQYLPPFFCSWENVLEIDDFWCNADNFKQISLKLYLFGWESNSHQRTTLPRKSDLGKKIHIMFCDSFILMCYVNFFVFFFNGWYSVIAGSRPVVLQLCTTPMAQEKHHPLVLKGRCTQCRHYSTFEGMQYEPQSVTFQL